MADDYHDNFSLGSPPPPLSQKNSQANSTVGLLNNSRDVQITESQINVNYSGRPSECPTNFNVT